MYGQIMQLEHIQEVPTVPVEETDEATIKEKVEGKSDVKVNLFGSCELLF